MTDPHPVTTTQSSTRQQRRTERTRARLLDAALEIFLERGYDATSLGPITERADLGTGTCYLYFRDKRAIYEAMVRRELLALRTQWIEQRAKVASSESGDEIALMVKMVLESLLGNVRLARLILLDGPPLETWLVADIGREMATVLGDRVREPELAAHLVIGATLTAVRWALNRPRPAPSRSLIADAIAFCSAGVAANVYARSTRKTQR